MVKKLKKSSDAPKATQANLLDSQLAAHMKDSAQQIWLAGMGAFARAQTEGGKVFEALVTEGTKLQRKTQSLAEDRIQEVASKMTAVADGVSSKAGAHWDKLESIFEERVAKALNKLGVPSRADIESLIARIDTLHAELAKPAKASSAAVSRPRGKPQAATKKAVRKPAKKASTKASARAN